ncbi:MAG: hypothetical protein MI975_19230 [Cytophagales bacterium]|nr:hypothetical protein [Cytophagales bacterium]
MKTEVKYITNTLDLIRKMIRYNFKIIFAGKFLYFLLSALAFFLLVTSINLFNGSDIGERGVFYLLLFPGMLLTFYPTVFGIQNDDDSRMLEIIFGIPNYRYKVWLVRFILIYGMVFLLLLLLSLLTSVALISFPVFEMVFHILFPLFFLGCLAFMFSTLVRNGNGTAVVMIIIGFFLFILGENIGQVEWNVFFNPFGMPSDLNETIWEERIFYNRLYLVCGGVIAFLTGMANLQDREKFI